MISIFAQRPTRFAKPTRPLALSLLGAALALQGCVVAPPFQMRPVYVQPGVVAAPAPAPVDVVPPQPATASAEVDLMPPVPSFATLADCESAYGPGSCGSGQAVYVSVGLAAPVSAETWFIPYAFGAMTGVLVNHYFAAPAAFVRGVDYHAFTAPGVVNGYKTINQTKINSYHKAPASVRSQLAQSGPARYSPSRGVITGKSSLAVGNPSHSLPTHPNASTAAARQGLHANAQASQPPRSAGGGIEGVGGRTAQSQAVHGQPARAPLARPQQALSPASRAMQSRPAMPSPRSVATPAARPQVRPVGRTQRVSFRRP